MIDYLYSISNGIASFADTVLKPPVYQASDLIFNNILIFATLFSALFYILALNGLLSRPKARDNAVEVPEKSLPFVTVQIPTFNEPVATVWTRSHGAS